MGSWWRLIIILWCLAIGKTGFAVQTDLQYARRMQDRGYNTAALLAYKKIPYGSDDWVAKLEDAMRYQFMAKNYEEAWRLSQMAVRLNIKLKHAPNLE